MGAILRAAVLAAMVFQIVAAIVWMAYNLTAIPPFNDAREYEILGESLELDEYRPILYPLFVRAANRLGAWMGVPYKGVVYLSQSLVAFACILLALRTVRSLLADRLDPSIAASRSRLLLAALYVWSFPMIVFMNFAGMTDAPALSMTLLFLSALLALHFMERPGRGAWAQLVLSFVVGSLVRGDRSYLFLAWGTVLTLALFAFRPGRRWRRLSVLVALVLSFAVVMGVNRATQTPGCHGRPKTTFSFVLLDRVVWPHMVECLELFPPEIREIVSRHDAKLFDRDNNNVMYYMAPLVVDAVGREHGEELFRVMAKTVFLAKPFRVSYEIVHDVAKAFFAPFAQTVEIYNVRCHRKPSRCINPYCYNFRNFLTRTPVLARILNVGGLHLFVLLFLGAVAWRIRTKSLRSAVRDARRVLVVFLGFAMMLALFYGLGDGAHPNSRYSLVSDFNWALVLLLLLSLRRASPAAQSGSSAPSGSQPYPAPDPSAP